MHVSVILVNWNQSEITIRCVESLLQNTTKDTGFSFDVVIVDNNSRPASVQILDDYLTTRPALPITLIKNPVNAGFAGGNNVGIRHVLTRSAVQYIWLLNNDIIVQAHAMNALVAAAMQKPEIKIWGSTIYELSPALYFHCAGGFRYNALFSIPRPVTFPKKMGLPKGLYYPLPQMKYPAGASMFISAATFRESGLLNETYFLYYEELDFTKQIGGSKHIAWCPDSVLHHQSGKSTGSKNPNKGTGSWIAHYYGNLSALKYTWLHHPWYFPFVFFFRFISKTFLFIQHKDFGSFTPLFNAYRDFFRWLPKHRQ